MSEDEIDVIMPLIGGSDYKCTTEEDEAEDKEEPHKPQGRKCKQNLYRQKIDGMCKVGMVEHFVIIVQ
jgi:hypothetical protein